MKVIILLCTLLVCVTLFEIGAIFDARWESEGEKWRALERTKYILDHQLPKPEIQKPSIEIPTEQDT